MTRDESSTARTSRTLTGRRWADCCCFSCCAVTKKRGLASGRVVFTDMKNARGTIRMEVTAPTSWWTSASCSRFPTVRWRLSACLCGYKLTPPAGMDMKVVGPLLCAGITTYSPLSRNVMGKPNQKVIYCTRDDSTHSHAQHALLCCRWAW